MSRFSELRFSSHTLGIFLKALVLFLVLAVLYCFWIVNRGPLENEVSYSNRNANVFDLSIPNDLNFCGEDIPTNDFRIKSVLEKEFLQEQYSHTSTQILFNRVQRWFGYIEPVLKQEGVPDDFKYLAVIESHLSNAHSPVGAAGFWQLMAGSAQANGLIVNSTVDERLDPEKATRAACRLIKLAYKVLHNWTLSAAAYNRGVNGILRAMKDQKTADYHRLLLNPETGTFVYRVLAYKTLLANPRHFAIGKKRGGLRSKIPYKIIKVDSSIHDLESFAAAKGLNYKELKAHNPWLIANSLENPDGHVFEIRVPKNKKADYSLYLVDLQTVMPLAVDTVPLLPDSLVAAPSATVFVDAEKTLEELSKEFKVSKEDLRKWNHLEEKDEVVKSRTLVIAPTVVVK